MNTVQSETLSIENRVDSLDWSELGESLNARGYAVTDPILAADECHAITRFYKDHSLFRSHVIMERYRFGVGDYKYLDYPLPAVIGELRSSAYPHLAKIANQWAAALGEKKPPYPMNHASFLRICHEAGQTKPTPLILHYESGGYNCLHQDLYGEIAFPIQMVFILGQPERDWEGGEFVLVEQQPRAQSKAEVIAAGPGQAIIFTTRYRPVKGTRGYYRVNIRHGVSRLRRGTRYTLGIIFHDAK